MKTITLRFDSLFYFSVAAFASFYPYYKHYDALMTVRDGHTNIFAEVIHAR